MKEMIYAIENNEEIITPCLIYYEEIIAENTKKAIDIAGGNDRLWPHVKSHKSVDMIGFQMKYGINQFKTATIAEAEMVAEAGAKRTILAYPLIGPNIRRFLDLMEAYPRTEFFAIGDDYGQLKQLSEAAINKQCTVNILIDVNMGMNRTGIVISRTEDLYRKAAKLPGIQMRGLHCYDGNHNNSDLTIRNSEVEKTDMEISKICDRLIQDGIGCDIIVAGGTPAFPCHAKDTQWYLSPGTAFLTDAGYYKNLPDLNFIPGAVLMTRVVSHPADNMFTIDLGYKGIASDPTGIRGYIVGMENAKSILHSEEHWVFTVEEEKDIPAIGTVLYVIPVHICPTSALYPSVLIARNHKIVNEWEITARNRKINI